MQAPFFELVPACAVVAAACWVLSITTREYSWVDRVWSIAPPCYALWMAHRAGFADPRLTLVFALVAAWGVRMTYNFARRGGYRAGGEDYRWAVLRARLGPRRFQLFNATFIAPFQNALLLLLTAPMHTMWQHRDVPLSPLELGLAVAFGLFLLGETIADQQQWDFHQDKARRAGREHDREGGPAKGEPVSGRERDREDGVARGFLDRGLFRYSRHPHYFCEMAMWWTIYGFAVAASDRWLHWTMAGPLLLTLLFQGTSRFTESLSLAKYPAYAEYQRTTSRLVPWWPRARHVDAA
jgi:steroid 5-alpha reductase family enzyme